MSSVWDMILQWGSTIKVSIELPVATRHRRDMTEKLLKATFNPNTHTHTPWIVHGVFYIAIFSYMTQCQRARYRVACYVIVNNVTTATLESKMKNVWKRRWQKRNWNSLNSLYLGVSDSFKDGSSKLNNHSAMAVGKFILALSVQFEFCFMAVFP